ncbi:MAG: hypothetical protein H0X43_10510 [Nitrosospira sp.]|nr:hypothetical protein [Nitrosospira sp.]
MKDKEQLECKRIDELKRRISSLQLGESGRTHEILEALIALVPQETRGEFVGLLETLSKDAPDRERRGFDRRRALQIVEGVCRPEHFAREAAQSQHESDRRVGERRQRDRRKWARNSRKPWTDEQIQALQTMVEQHVPVRRIALKLGRTSTAVLAKAKEIKLALRC